jgi:hypothetical protein
MPSLFSKKSTSAPKKKYVKQKIPVAFREQIWIRTFGKEFQGKCPTSWCQNTITVFDFQSGHNIPESKGGKTNPDNLIPICSRCNLSMSNNYTFTEWNAINQNKNNPTLTQITTPSNPIQTNIPVKHTRCCFFPWL